jgi:two-component system sensor histidine kinase/response regulator
VSIWRWPLLLQLAAVVALTLAAIAWDHAEKMRHQRGQVEAVADLRSTEVQAWLKAQLAQAEFASSSKVWADLYRRWNERGDTAARDQLMSRVSDLRQAFGNHSAWVLDAKADLVATDAPVQRASVSPALRKAALRR